nr:CapA family protein [uncultured Actinotalea sp.]
MRIALLGDTMLGRGVGDRIREEGPAGLVADDVREVLAEADLVVANLECAISERGERWPDPRKPFFFRAPPAAVEVLRDLRVSCVTLANDHALDDGPDALLDTVDHVRRPGIAVVGAGPDVHSARAPAVLTADGLRVAVLGVADHPAEYAANGGPGTAYADLAHGVPQWLLRDVQGADADVVLVTPHWGPNFVTEPVPAVRRAAGLLLDAGATLVAGHSAHVFHGVGERVLFDLGEALDDYAVDPVRRNDLGLLAVVVLDGPVPVRVEAVPLRIEHGRTRRATGDDAAWVAERFAAACADLGTPVRPGRDRLVVDWAPDARPRRRTLTL